jgi:hypothetical protein
MATFTHQKSPNFRMTQGMAGVDKIPAYQYPDAITDSRRLKYYLDCFPVMESAIATEDEHAAIHPESRGAIQPRNEDWRRRARQSFLADYRAAIGGCPSFLRNEALFNQLIGVFVLERALYEICHETANRSDWIHIPLAEVVGIIDHGK